MVNTIFSHIIHDYFVMFALNDPILIDDIKINLVYYNVQFTSMPIYVLVIKNYLKFLQYRLI